MPTPHLRNELANSFSHFIGLVLCLIGVPIIIWKASSSGNWMLLSGVVIFGASLLLTYAASMSYHGFMHPAFKNRLLVLDRISIFYLIAGSYTPFIILYKPDSTGLFILSVEWGLALFGTLFNLKYHEQHNWVSLIIYVGMGVMGFFFGDSFLSQIPQTVMNCLYACAACYLIGVVFYLIRSIPHHHLWWHSLVMAGSFSHYLALLRSLS